jgi:hypothetical protein
LQHLQIAIGITERYNRPTPNVQIDADRLAGAVVDDGVSADALSADGLGR